MGVKVPSPMGREILGLNSPARLLWLLLGLLLLGVVFSAFLGAAPVALSDWRLSAWRDPAAALLWHIRLPRLCLAAVVGAGLASAGAAMQGLFRNPLADPGLLALLSGDLGIFDTLLTLAGCLGGPLLALWLMRPLAPHPARRWGLFITETGLLCLAPVALLVLLARFLPGLSAHATFGIEASALLLASYVQYRRRALAEGQGRWLSRLRLVLAVLFGSAGTLVLCVGMTLFAPVWGDNWLRDPVYGLPLLNDLILAYAAPALVLFWCLKTSRWRLVALLPAAWRCPPMTSA